MPQARPSVMLMNIAQISFAVPAAERKRISENAPATATPAPTEPFTIMMTTVTIAGSMASVVTKLFELSLFFE